MKKQLVILMFCLFCMSSTAFAALDNKGTDFLVGFLENYTGNLEAVELHLTCDEPTEVRVEYPAGPSPTFIQDVSLTPGNVSIVSLPLEAHRNWSNGAILENLVRAYTASENEFVCYLINRRQYTSDASLAIPIDTLNTDYITITYPSSYNEQFLIMAPYDDTSVDITFEGGSTTTVTLDGFQGYFYQGDQGNAVAIQATRPVGVLSGNQCINFDGSACDHIFEMLPPIQAWGTHIPAVNIPETDIGVRYSIAASEEGTNVMLDGAAFRTMAEGEVFLTGRISGSHIWEADKPIMVAQYIQNRSSSGGAPIGDPAIGILTPSPQYMQNYTFSTVGGAQFAENNVTIIAETADVGSVELDGAIIPSGDFTAIGTTGFSSHTAYIDDGVHTTFSPGFHGITVMGFNSYDSYLYTGGALFQFINPKGDPWAPECSLTGSGPIWTGEAYDDIPSEDINGNDILDPGEDGNGNGVIDADTGIFLVELASGAVNMSLTVDSFVPGDSMVNYEVSVDDPDLAGSATLVVTDGAGNTCSQDIEWDAPGEPCELCGDFDDDCDVDMDDRNILRAGFGGSDPALDLNEDGVIDMYDYREWYNCYKAANIPQ